MEIVNSRRARRRSVLCVPAGDHRMLLKALAAGADEVVVDLEDAVAHDDKDRARHSLVDFSWPQERPAVAVRVNAAGSPWCHRDLAAVAPIREVTSVVLPKVESRADVGFAERLLAGLEAEAGRADRVAVQALVETAAGITGLADIVSAVDRLVAVVVGYADLAASLGRPRDLDPALWRTVQDAVVIQATAAGVDAVDGPHLGVADDDGFRAASQLARELGFAGKWVIHPRQVGSVTAAFTPPQDSVDHARRVLAALEGARFRGRGASVVDGALVDEAMALAARRLLSRAEA